MGLFDIFGGGKKRAAEEEKIAEEQKQREHDRLTEEAKQAHEGMPWPSVVPLNRMKKKDDDVKALAEDPISDERKEELGQLIFEPKITADDIKDLSLQEVIFLYQAHALLNKKSALPDYEQNSRVFYNEVLRRIHEAKQLYMLINKQTGYPLLDGPFGLVYLEEDHAKKAAELYSQQFRQAVAVTRPGEAAPLTEDGKQPIALFDYLYYLGIENVLIDNGWYKLPIKRSEISAPPTSFVSDNAKRNDPPADPALQFAMIDFENEARWPVKYEKRDELLKAKMARVNELIPAAKFVVPVQELSGEANTQAPEEKTGREVKLPAVKLKAKKADTGEEMDMNFLPVFTDLFEYAKGFNQPGYRPAVFPFDRVLGLLGAVNGFVINPRGESVVVPKEQAALMLQAKLKKDNPAQYEQLQKNLRAMAEARAKAMEKAKAAGAGATGDDKVVQFPGNHHQPEGEN